MHSQSRKDYIRHILTKQSPVTYEQLVCRIVDLAYPEELTAIFRAYRNHWNLSMEEALLVPLDTQKQRGARILIRTKLYELKRLGEIKRNGPLVKDYGFLIHATAKLKRVEKIIPKAE